MAIQVELPEAEYPGLLRELDEPALRFVSQAKRFVQRFKADPAFRERVEADAAGASRALGLDIDPELIRPLWDFAAGRQMLAQGQAMSPETQLCLRFDREVMLGWAMRYRSPQHFSHPAMRAWWERQVRRNATEVGAPVNANIVHAPLCFELCAGCTVGCWFCGLSAEPFEQAFPYNEENRRLWREVLEVVYRIIGPAARSGFCYWATEPLDNPDYERFIDDYFSVIGALPSTTTALAPRQIERTRALIRMWKTRSFVANHFSVLSLRLLDRIHGEFTPEELLLTGMKFVNKGSSTPKATAGRALERARRRGEAGMDMSGSQDALDQGTIACVTGFLINMVSRRVQLVSPCRATEQWPKGYRVYAEAQFSTAEELEARLLEMVEQYMPQELPADSPVYFRKDLEYVALPQGFRLSTRCWTQDFVMAGLGRGLGELLSTQKLRPSMIVDRLAAEGAQPQAVMQALGALFQSGVLEDVAAVT